MVICVYYNQKKPTLFDDHGSVTGISVIVVKYDLVPTRIPVNVCGAAVTEPILIMYISFSID